MSWPPGADHKRLTEVREGTEVLVGTACRKVYKIDPLASGGFQITWDGEGGPVTNYAEEPTLTVWPADQGT